MNFAKKVINKVTGDNDVVRRIEVDYTPDFSDLEAIEKEKEEKEKREFLERERKEREARLLAKDSKKKVTKKDIEEHLRYQKEVAQQVDNSDIENFEVFEDDSIELIVRTGEYKPEREEEQEPVLEDSEPEEEELSEPILEDEEDLEISTEEENSQEVMPEPETIATAPSETSYELHQDEFIDEDLSDEELEFLEGTKVSVKEELPVDEELLPFLESLDEGKGYTKESVHSLIKFLTRNRNTDTKLSESEESHTSVEPVLFDKESIQKALKNKS